MDKSFIDATKDLIQEQAASQGRTQTWPEQHKEWAEYAASHRARVGELALCPAAQGRPARLVWRAVIKATGYEVEVNADPQKVRQWVAAGTMLEPEVPVDSLPLPGPRLWIRIRVLFDNQVAPWGDPQRVELPQNRLDQAA